jgi:dsDNA-binding SOS-regulon protein
MLPIITDTALNALSEAALKVQAELFDRTGERYDILDLNDVLARWLESSIEALCEEACELCVTGDLTYASFNRSYFETALRRVPSVNVWEQQAEANQQAVDQAALALERVA